VFSAVVVATFAVAFHGPTLKVSIPPAATAIDIEASIQAARKKQSPGQTLVVKLPPSELLLDRTVNLSGENIQIVGSKGSVISGAAALRSWRTLTDLESTRFPAAARQNIRVADVPEGLPMGTLIRRGFGLNDRLAHSELFVDGQPMQLARFPNANASDGGWLRTGETEGPRIFKDPFARPARWKNPGDAWVYGYWQFDWADSVEPLEGFDAATNQVKIRDTGDPVKGGFGSFGLNKGRRFFYLNVPEELDASGEYWVDSPNRRVYAWLPEGAREMRVSMLGAPLIHVNKAKNLIFQNVTLEGSRQCALQVDESEMVSLRDSRVRNTGGAGVTVASSKNSGIFNCEIRNCGESAVSLDGGDFTTLTPAANFVENCLIERVSRWCRTYRPGVMMNGVGQRIIGNTFADLPHNAILFGGNDHLIERNDIRRVCLETGDAGAIYIGRNPTTRGTVIKNNRFREIEPRTNTEGNYTNVMSVYLDDCQCGITITGNVFEGKGTAIMIGGGRDNVVTGNVFIDPQPGIHFDQRGKGWAKDMFKADWGYLTFLKQRPVESDIWKRKYPALYQSATSGADLALAENNVVAGNVHSGKKWIEYLDGLTQANLIYSENVSTPMVLTVDQAIRQIPAKYGKIDLKMIGRRAK
jgi:hypothetical protein